VLRPVEGEWTFLDSNREQLTVHERLLPDLVVADGEVIVPDCGLLADVMAPSERPRGITRRPSYLAVNVATLTAH
jgi:hypothetical protein